jgi:outer membrane lipoprotein carrier protein
MRLVRALVCVALTALPATAAGPPPVEQLLSALESSAREVTTLKGEFTQRNRSQLFEKELRSTGRIYYRRPRQIRWEYLAPDPSTLVLDGQKATLTTPGQPAQVFDLERDATMRTVFDQLLLWLAPDSLTAARQAYDLAVSGTRDEPALVLTPKPGGQVAKAFSRIALRVDGKTHLLRGIVLTERNGDEKELLFVKLQRNAPLPPDAFR